MILTEWFWVHIAIFNNDCSPNVKYVIFVVKADALGTGRIIALILTSVLIAGYAAITFHELRVYYLFHKQHKALQNHPIRGSNRDSGSTEPSTTVYPEESYAENAGASKKTRRPRRKQWSGNWDPMLLGITAVQPIVFAYFVVSTELLLWWNPHQTDGKTWGFGQILALIVTIPSALTVFDAFSEHGFRPMQKRKGKRGKSRQESLAHEIV